MPADVVLEGQEVGGVDVVRMIALPVPAVVVALPLSSAVATARPVTALWKGVAAWDWEPSGF